MVQLAGITVTLTNYLTHWDERDVRHTIICILYQPISEVEVEEADIVKSPLDAVKVIYPIICFNIIELVTFDFTIENEDVKAQSGVELPVEPV